MPNFCPDCGSPVTREDASFCEECGADFDDDASNVDVDDFLDEDDASDDGTSDSKDLASSSMSSFQSASTVETSRDLVEVDRGSRFFEKAFVGFVAVIGFVGGYLGGFALFIWALALLNEHWGFFWAALGFFTIFFTLVVVVTCFFWGVPYFFFAFLTWIAALSAMASVEGSKKSAALSLCAVLAFGGIGGYLAWKDAVTPDPITARVMDRLTDDAMAVIAVLRSTQQDDAEAAIASTRAKGRLRDELGEYDVARKDAIEEMVGQYLKFERAMERDMMAFIERRIKGEKVEFSLSPSTQAALDALPDRMRKTFSSDTEDFDAINILFNDRDLDDIPDNWRQMMTFALKKRWNDYGAAYQDVMGRPMPTPQ